MLLLYLLLLGALAAFTAYTRNFQSSVITLEQQIPGGAGTIVTPWRQTLRTIGLVLGWPAAFGIGLLFVGWWKAAALVVGAFLLLVPVVGSFTPRPMSAHYVERIRSDLAQRLARSVKEGRDAAALARLLEQLDALSRQNRPRQAPKHPP